MIYCINKYRCHTNTVWSDGQCWWEVGDIERSRGVYHLWRHRCCWQPWRHEPAFGARPYNHIRYVYCANHH